MVKVRFILGLILLARVAAMAQVRPAFLGASRTVTAASSINYVLQDGFEETDTGGSLPSNNDGYDDNQILGESVAKPLRDYASSPLIGSQSLGMTNGCVSRWTLSAVGRTNLEVYFLFKPSVNSPAGSTVISSVQSSAGNDQGTVVFSSAGYLRPENGSASTNPASSTLVAGTTYHVKYRWNTNGVTELWYNKTGVWSYDATNYTFATNGTGNTVCERVRLDAASVNATPDVFDHLLVTTNGPIPNTP